MLKTKSKSLPLPSDDRRWQIVNATMRRHGYEADALIEVLHSVQSAFGYLDRDAIKFVARSLNVPLSRAYGVATFYEHFTMKPKGAHTCVVCLGTACYIKGTPAILGGIEEKLHIQEGETTADSKVSLLSARCLGACGMAPAAVFDGEMVGKLSPDDALARVERWTAE